jgi:hypothetical protein
MLWDFKIFFYVNSHAGVQEAKEAQLVHHCGCRYVEGRCAWDGGEREQWRQMEV